ncbi:MAG: hypothetical protein H6831_13550 [Planctomycetes bacterium]|nr:hypothetical protein [Planctomycetota bacterium]
MSLAPALLRLSVGCVALALCAGFASADCPDDDPFVANDDCFAPEPLPSFLSGWFTIYGQAHAGGLDEDYWVVEDVFPGESVQLDVFYLVAGGDVDVELYADLGCSNLLDVSNGGTGNESVSATNAGPGLTNFYVHIVAADPALDCNNYSMSITRIAAPCASPPNDALEPNDSCAAAPVIGVGTTPVLNLSGTSGDPRDHYAIDVPAGELLTIDMLYAQGGASPDLTLYVTSACDSAEAVAFGINGSAQLEWANGSGATQRVYLRVWYFVGGAAGCGEYVLNVASVPAPCLATDDAFEDNDDCAAAVPLQPGTTANLHVSADVDYYSILVPAGNALTVEVEYVAAVVEDEVYLYLYDSTDCANQVDTTWIGGGPDFVDWINDTGADRTVVLRVDIDSAHCNDYDLHVFSALDPCLAGLPEDPFEDNDDCLSAAVLLPGFQAGLTLRQSDEDYYAIDVPGGQSLHVLALFAAPSAGIELFLYDSVVLCGDTSLGPVARGNAYELGQFLTWLNSSSTNATVYLQVQIRPLPQIYPECGAYDLDVSLGGDPGTSFCAGDGSDGACPCGNESALGAGEGCAGSQGHGAVLSATGSASIANDDLAFGVTGARPGQPSLLVRGSQPIALPFKDGLFCMGGPTLRVGVIALDASGAGTSSFSVVHAGPVTPLPGQTDFFQQWYRDPAVSPCGSGSNFSQGVIVVWQ